MIGQGNWLELTITVLVKECGSLIVQMASKFVPVTTV